MKTVQQKIDAVDKALRRWQARLNRAVNAINKLQRQRKRLAKPQRDAFVKSPVPKQRVTVAIAPGPLPVAPEEVVTVTLDEIPIRDEIPAFLDRSDPLIAEKMTAARKAAEAEERSRMPLSGRAAMAKIREKPKKK